MKRKPLKPSKLPQKRLVGRKIGLRGKNPTLGRIGPRRRRKKGEVTKLKEELWGLCRQIVKKRYGNSCYTCGREVPDGKGMHTAHYITSSLCSVALRYDLRNLRTGCYNCNINLSGNWPAYQKRVEQELGPEITATLLKENEETKGLIYGTDWFERQITHYKTLLEKES